MYELRATVIKCVYDGLYNKYSLTPISTWETRLVSCMD